MVYEKAKIKNHSNWKSNTYQVSTEEGRRYQEAFKSSRQLEWLEIPNSFE